MRSLFIVCVGVSSVLAGQPYGPPQGNYDGPPQGYNGPPQYTPNDGGNYMQYGKTKYTGKYYTPEDLYLGLKPYEAQVIADMFAWRHDIQRKVTHTDYGVRTWTTSENPEVANWIIEHYYQMADAIKKRKYGARYFSEDDRILGKARGPYGTDVWSKGVPNQYGMYVEHYGETKCAKAAVQGHAKGVSLFLEPDGFDWALGDHPAPKECGYLINNDNYGGAGGMNYDNSYGGGDGYGDNYGGGDDYGDNYGGGDGYGDNYGGGYGRPKRGRKKRGGY